MPGAPTSAEFPISREGLTAAQARVAAEAAAGGWPHAVSQRLAVILDEVVANLLMHDGSIGPGDRFRLTLGAGGGIVRMGLSDPGGPFDPLGAEGGAGDPERIGAPGRVPPGRTGPAPVRPGGHGLALIRRLAPDVAYRRADGRNELSIAIPLSTLNADGDADGNAGGDAEA